MNAFIGQLKMSGLVLIGIIVSVFFSGFLADASAQIKEVQQGGRELFVQHCAACHGTNAEGTGPLTSQIKGIPPNLTELAKRNGGVFPFWHIYRVIDGREYIMKHGPREMPAWGNWFQIPADEIQGPTDWRDQVRGRIWQLLTYLESIQKPG